LTSRAARFPGVLSVASTVAEAICVGVPEIPLRSSPATPVPSMTGAVPAVAVSASAVRPVGTAGRCAGSAAGQRGRGGECRGDALDARAGDG
jgi:hypothetical protein